MGELDRKDRYWLVSDRKLSLDHNYGREFSDRSVDANGSGDI
jgi:hypothetical protein